MDQNPIASLLSAVPGQRKGTSRPLREAQTGHAAPAPRVMPVRSGTAGAYSRGQDEVARGLLEMEDAGGKSLDRLSAAAKEGLAFERQRSAKVQQALLPQGTLDFPGLDTAA